MNIGKFEIVEELGRGAMGIVYKAHDPKIGRMVALKTLSSEIMSAPDALSRFYREAQSAGRLDHPNIVTVFELGDDKGAPYIAMEFVEGEDLSGIIKSRKELPLHVKIEIIAQVCRGLEYAHQRGIIHRDIKPANIILKKDGSAKIVDFGIARIVSHEMTQSGMLLGTVSYMSPEQAEGVEIDGRSDVFSTGCLLYELLTYGKAFPGGNVTEIIVKILHQNPVPLRKHPHLAGAPIDRLELILALALAKDRRKRYQSAQEFAQALQTFLQSTGAPGYSPTAASQPRTPTRRPSRRIALAAGGVLALVLLTAGGTYLYRLATTKAPAMDPPASAILPADTSRSGSVALNVLPWGEVTEIVQTATGRTVPLNGKLYTPVQISLPRGPYRITLVNPYLARESLILDVEVVQDRLKVVTATIPNYDVNAYLREN